MTAIEHPARSQAVLLAGRGRLSYIVLDCLKQIGFEVLLVCDPRSSIRYSSYVNKIIFCDKEWGQKPEEVARAIRAQHLSSDTDVVIAAAVPGLLLLDRIAGEIGVPAFPSSPAEILRLLDDKARFGRLCERLGVRTPQTLSFEGDRLEVDQISERLGFPCVVKPLSASGGVGVCKISTREQLELLAAAPPASWARGCVVQRQILGADVHAVMFCVAGEVRQIAGYRDVGENFSIRFEAMPELFAAAAEIVRATGYTGVACFDAIREAGTGDIYMLECNPRLFMRVGACFYAGVDFISAGLRHIGVPQSVQTRARRDSYVFLGDALGGYGLQLMRRGEFPLREMVEQLRGYCVDPVPRIAPLLRSLVSRPDVGV